MGETTGTLYSTYTVSDSKAAIGSLEIPLYFLPRPRCMALAWAEGTGAGVRSEKGGGQRKQPYLDCTPNWRRCSLLTTF